MKSLYKVSGVMAVVILLTTVGFFIGLQNPEKTVVAETKKVSNIKVQTVQVKRSVSDRQHNSAKQPSGYYQMFYDRALPTPKIDQDIRVGIVPHHLLVGRYIASAFNGMSSKKIKRVVLISPDHFARGKTRVSATVHPWETPFGKLLPDTKYIESLVNHAGVYIDPEPFDGEHGISGLVPFVKKSFPNAKIVPIVVRDDLSEDGEQRLARALGNIDDKTIIIGSFDFSHYVPHNAAEFHDATSQTVLELLDHETARRLDIDSQPGLAIVLRAAKRLNAPHWNQVLHASSASLSENHDTKENTSYFAGYFTSGPIPWHDKITMHFFGDMMFDRGVRNLMEKHGNDYVFQNVERFMMGSDVVIGNLEGAITTNKSIAGNLSPLLFTFDPSVAATMKKFGITDVSLANNHSRNFGQDGLDQTKHYLTKEGIRYFGDQINEENISYWTEVRGTKIGWVGFSAFGGKQNDVIDEIRRLRNEVDVLVVMPHWGAEYKLVHGRSQTRLAHTFIDSGADMVIGAHPHVIQPMEIYKGKPIFYSLGNFVFDQYFSKDVTVGLSVGVEWEHNKMKLRLFVLQNNQGEIDLATPEKRDEILKRISKTSIVSPEVSTQIRSGVIHLEKE